MARSKYAEHVSGMRREGSIDRHTYLQNTRAYAVRGQDLGQAKLNDDAVREIRKAAEQREDLRQHIKENLSNEAMAKKFKVHVRTIEKALSYHSWIHI